VAHAWSPLIQWKGERVPPLNAIRVQKLFAVAICLKVASSGFGWWLNDPWILGFGIPLLVMAGYVAFGLRR
jgi:hypothetical protein